MMDESALTHRQTGLQNAQKGNGLLQLMFRNVVGLHQIVLKCLY